jgi:hypothetical protein
MIDSKYPLKESPSASCLQRTEWNVRDSDATVLFSIAPSLSGGSKKTVEFARKHNKPCLHLHARQQGCRTEASRFPGGYRGRDPSTSAGPRASKEPNVAQFVLETFDRVFGAGEG